MTNVTDNKKLGRPRLHEKRDHSTTVSFKLDDEDLSKLQALEAEVEGMTARGRRSVLLRTLIRTAFLNRNNNKT